jgi:UDP-2,3-diacylglucosamine hydrolase
LSDLIVVADSHLSGEDSATEDFVRFLSEQGPTAEAVILAGDIFDLWVARQALELPFHREVIRAVTALRDRGVRVDYVQGNRDYFVAHRYPDGPFRQVAEESLTIRHGGRTIHIAHGDLVNPDDRQYLRWRRFSRSAPVRGLFGALPGPLASSLSLRLERRFRTTNQAFRIRFPEEHARRYARQVFTEGADTIVLGHFHQQRELEFPDGKLFVLPGWREDRAYLRIDDAGRCRFLPS